MAKMIDKKLVEWWCCGDVGVSSKAIVFVMCGVSPKTILQKDWSPYPHDAGDFARCYQLLKLFPDWRGKIVAMGCLGKIWEGIAKAWEELELLYEQGKYKELYARLQQLQPDELEENCNKVTLGKITISTAKDE